MPVEISVHAQNATDRFSTDRPNPDLGLIRTTRIKHNREVILLASRMVQIASDLRDDAQRYGLLDPLGTARNIAANRSSLGEGGYRQEVRKLRSAATTILTSNIFNEYPIEEMAKLDSSDISALLPRRIASLILTSLPEVDMKKASASSEFDIYIEEALRVYNEITGFLSFANSIGIEHYKIKEENAALELFIPRLTFGNELSSFGDKLSLFDKWLVAVSEYVHGQRLKPKIVYISTSDPLIYLEWVPTIISAALVAYTPILEAAERTVNLAKTIKELLNIGAPAENTEQMKENLNKRNEEVIREKVGQSLDTITSPLQDGRKQEVRNEIIILSIQVVHEVSHGARISVGAGTYADGLPKVSETSEDISAVIAHQKQLEIRIENLLATRKIDKQLLQHQQLDDNSLPKSE